MKKVRWDRLGRNYSDIVGIKELLTYLDDKYIGNYVGNAPREPPIVAIQIWKNVSENGKRVASYEQRCRRLTSRFPSECLCRESSYVEVSRLAEEELLS